MAINSSLGTPEQLRDPNYTPPLASAVPLGIQHVLAMFVSNVTPAIIIAGAAGFGFGSNSPDFPHLIYMIQMSMLFAGVATLFQTIGFGPVGARLPIVQGTSFAFIPIMIPLVAGKGVDAMGALMCGVIVGGLFHALLGTIIGKIRFALPPLVTGLVVTMIGLALVKVGIQYAAGGVPAMFKLTGALAAAKSSGTPADLSGVEYGSLLNWGVALVVIVVTLGVKFFTRGIVSVAAVLIGLIVGYVVAYFLGMVSFDNVGRAAVFALPQPFHFGFDFSIAAIVGFCLMSFISAVETVGDVSGITKGGAGREATTEEIRGATFADGIGTFISGLFGALPNTSFSQNVGLIAMTGVMSRTVVTIGALFLIAGGFFPKVGAVISTVPIEVLGGGVIVMFGMVVAAGISMLSDVNWNRRNMVIFAISISVGLGLQLEPNALFHLPVTAKVLLTSGLLPAAFLAILLNLVLPEEIGDDQTEEIAGGLAGHKNDQAAPVPGDRT
ncbi:MAG: nucleobase:cation symporter-2 family protein [Anderseniella sp.]